MNYFEFHIGDYAAATQHLSDEEDLAYRRLLDAYYRDERPIPADLRAACRLARARTDSMRDAVDVVLREFFVLEADGWHNRRAARVIAEYRAGEPEREARKANEAERQRRHREARRAMFEQLRAVGVVPDWNIGARELQALVTRYCAAPVTPATRDAAAPVTPETDLSRVTTVTGHGYPSPTSHSPPPTSHLPEKSLSEANGAKPKFVTDDPDRYLAFEGAYPKSIHTKGRILVERECLNAIGRGATWDEIIGGARRYRVLCDATQRSAQHVQGAHAWLREDRYREAFEIPSEPAAGAAAPRKGRYDTWAEQHAMSAEEAKKHGLDF